MKKVLFIILGLFLLIDNVSASDYCTESTVEQMAKIIYREVGGTINNDPDEDFFAKLVTASVVLNNANRKSGVTFIDKMYNLTNSDYGGYSTYKTVPFENYVPASEQAKLLYIAELVLSGQFTVPKEMIFQADPWDIEPWGGIVWTSVKATCLNCSEAVYFGYSGSLSNEDTMGNALSSTSADHYRQLAASLRKSDYSSYTTSTICQHSNNNNQGSSSGNQGSSSGSNNQGSSGNNHGSSNGNSGSTNQGSGNSGSHSSSSGNQGSSGSGYTTTTNTPLCQNPNALRAIYIVKTIIQVVKILVPVIIIITSIISFSKTILYDEDIKKATGLFLTKVFVGAMIFFIPTIVKATLSFVDTNLKTFNFNECYNNATLDKIRQLEKKK